MTEIHNKEWEAYINENGEIMLYKPVKEINVEIEVGGIENDE